jgi:hypothetical protein
MFLPPMLPQLEALLLELAADPPPAALELALAALPPPLSPAAALELELVAAVGLELKKESPPKKLSPKKLSPPLSLLSECVECLKLKLSMMIDDIFDDDDLLPSSL